MTDHNDRVDIHRHLNLRMCNDSGLRVKPSQGGVRWYMLDKDNRGKRFYRLDSGGNEVHVPDVLVPEAVKRQLRGS